MPYRHPSVLANIAATVDVISDGRLIVGLGAGWNEEESHALGLRLPPLKERFDQFEEGVQVILALLSEDRVTFDGAHFQLRDAWCEPKPVQRPHPPIAIGGNGEKRTLKIVARYAQHWNSTLGDVEAWQHKRAVLEQHCADVGRDPAEIELSVNVRLAAGADPQTLQPTIEALDRGRRRRLHHRPRRAPLTGRAGPAGRGPRPARLTRSFSGVRCTVSVHLALQNGLRRAAARSWAWGGTRRQDDLVDRAVRRPRGRRARQEHGARRARRARRHRDRRR